MTDNKAWMEEIAQRLDDIANGNLYSVDGDCKTWDELTEEEQQEYEENKDDYDARIQLVTMSDYIEENYGVWYTVNWDKEYCHGKICIAWGGPNVYIDTNDGKVKLYWWSDYAEAYLSNVAVDALDSALEDLYECT